MVSLFSYFPFHLGSDVYFLLLLFFACDIFFKKKKKRWPGGLGRTANFAVVYARLILPSGDHGVHPFLVQIRSLEDHKVSLSYLSTF